VKGSARRRLGVRLGDVAALWTGDLIYAGEAGAKALSPHSVADWRVRAGDLDWTCRRTLGHIVDALALYSDHLATRAVERWRFKHEVGPDVTIEELLHFVPTQASVLARVSEASRDVRAYHPPGMADATGFVAMGCDEILVHTNDICAGLGFPFNPEPDLSAKVVARLFPWAPDHPDPWERLLWCNGRIALPDHERLREDWWWWSRPLDEWDGTVHTRTQPPAWS
jgi:hypothetical protein